MGVHSLSKRRADRDLPAFVPSGARNVPRSLWVVIDEDGMPNFSSPFIDSCHEHIADAMNNDDLASLACHWVVREYRVAASEHQDMGQGHLRVGLDADNDVYVEVCDQRGTASVEFCNPGGGGGGLSPRTRAALIELMRAIESDNADTPALDWWAARASTEGAAK